MPKVYFKISIKSFEHSTLQLVKKKIEKLCIFIDSMEALSSSMGSSAYGSQPVKCKATQEQVTPLAVLDISKKEKSYSSTYLPSSKRRFTLLRSPHIDKKSREQFQLQTFKAEIDTSYYTRGKACLLLLFLRNSQLMGVELKIAINYSTPFSP
ncbi:Ribosomal protein S10 (mitochondrion) [Coccomyxa sp. Obi]|nr:Ribosomal protein S10 [Coccomyxa sp. Obi]